MNNLEHTFLHLCPPMQISHRTTISNPIPMNSISCGRRPSRLEVTDELLRDITEAKNSPREHGKIQGSSFETADVLNESSQGAYLMMRRETGKPVGVFKSVDDEVLRTPTSPKLGVVMGDGPVKEHAAYVLDHGGLAGVPRTETVKIMEQFVGNSVDERDAELLLLPQRVGSLQEFREHLCTSEDLGPSLFPVEDVHHIALLDLRLFNLDRHLGNILVQRKDGSDDKNFSLIPIDHAYTLPSFRCLSDAWFCWTSWRQSTVPFSQQICASIAELNPFSDIAELKRIGLRDECILTYVLCTVFVKECVEHGWNLREMAIAMQRDVCKPEEISDFECLVATASERAEFDKFEFAINAPADESWGCAVMLTFLDHFEDLVQRFVIR